MGCCIGTNRPLREHRNHPNAKYRRYSPNSPSMPGSGDTHVGDSHCNRAPPPAEEETVKEVLSETPIPKPNTPIAPKETQNQKMAVLQDNKIAKPEEISAVSQASDMWSASESFSTTTTVTEKKEDEATSKENREMGNRVRRRSTYTGELAGRRERRAAKSPARRPEPSLEKRAQVGARSARGMDSGQVRSRKLNVGATAVRQYSGQGTGRRSGSPATHAAGEVGRRGVRRSPMTVTGKAGMEGGSKKEELNDGVLQQGSESIENPLVSLECFIFL